MPSFSPFALSPAAQRALATMGISAPTPIQEQALPALLAGRDLVGQAVTGSGKTLAFALPLVEACDPARAAAQALVLTPTRELAVQVLSVIEKLARERGLRSTLLIGGRSMLPQQEAIARGVQIIVGTPGRVLDHLRQGTLKLATIRYLVLDEADEMLDRGFGPDVERILSHAPQRRQLALFSATIPSWVEDVAGRYLHDPVYVRIPATERDRPAIEQTVYDVPLEGKLDVLRALLDERGPGSVVIFGRTKHGVRRLGRQLTALGYPVTALQGNLSQNARDRVMEDFRSGKLPILVATNVAARGLDVLSVERVINYELPESAELFTHRIGRTGRMGRSGEAITLLSPDEAPKWRQLERTLGRTLTRRSWAFADGKRPAAATQEQLAAFQEAARETTRRGSRSAAPRRDSRDALSAANGSRDNSRHTQGRARHSGRRDGMPAGQSRAADSREGTEQTPAHTHHAPAAPAHHGMNAPRRPVTGRTATPTPQRRGAW
ncbi:MAG: hypothetical protein NVSMB65_00070 [Chloroflexota bacterium]